VPVDEWVVYLPGGLAWSQVDGAVVVDENGDPVTVDFTASRGNRLYVIPVKPFDRSSSYSLRLFLSDGRRLCKSFTTQHYPKLDPGQVVEVQACPSEGFNYPYLLYVPAGIDKSRQNRLLVEPNNTGFPSPDFEIHLMRARELVRGGLTRRVAEDMSLPLLVPVFPRTYAAYTHQLTRAALLIEEGTSLHRIDLQLLAMIEDAKALLAFNGIQTKEKVFMNGFSASSKFSTRFALLHPETVRAVAAGGVAGIITFPLSTYEGKTLRYPVGIADLEELTGIEFNMEEYRKVAQLIYWGDQDTNDTVPYADCFDPQDTELIWSIFGRSLQGRWAKTQEIVNGLDVSIQFITYEGVGHRPGSYRDILEFFRANDNDLDGITTITSVPEDISGP